MSTEKNDDNQDSYYGLHEDNFYFDPDIPSGVDLNSHTPARASNGTLSDERKAQYAEELRKIEEEMQTLRQVLAAKGRRQRFLKEQLGLTMMSELRTGVNKGMDNLRSSEAYQKTTSVMKTAKDKTSAALQQKWNVLKQTNAYKSFEDTLGTAFNSVKWPSPATNLSLTEPESIVNKLVRSPTLKGSSSGIQYSSSGVSIDAGDGQDQSTSAVSVKSTSSRPTTPSLQIAPHSDDETEEFTRVDKDPMTAKDQFLD